MVSTIAALVFPGRCPGCGAAGEPLCAQCRATALPAPNLSVPEGLGALFVPFAYDGVVRELVARAKYRRRHAALDWLASEMVGAMSTRGREVDVVTWAPTTGRRRRERGFDQAELLAVGIGSALGLPVRARLRRRSGAAQTGASRAVRVNRPDFAARTVHRVRDARPSARETVLLVDDVVTTGATMRAAARALHAVGSFEVLGIAAARRP